MLALYAVVAIWEGHLPMRAATGDEPVQTDHHVLGEWSGRFGGENGIHGSVFAIASGLQGQLYVGGSFANAGTTVTSNIAMWDGSRWFAVGDGLDSTVYSLAMDGEGRLYAGGSFTLSGSDEAEHVARWDGTDWTSLASEITNAGTPGVAPAVYANRHDPVAGLYVGGDFTEIDGVEARGIALWDGAEWAAVGGGFQGVGCVDLVLDDVRAMTRSADGDLLAAGNMRFSASTEINGLARFVGSHWESMGSGVGVEACSAIHAIGRFEGAVYAGGSFDRIGGTEANGLAKWTGSAWDRIEDGLGHGFSGSVSALRSSSEGIYVGAGPILFGSTETVGVIRWTGTEWEALGSGLNEGARVFAIEVTDRGVFVGGENITSAGDRESFGVAKWEPAVANSREHASLGRPPSAQFGRAYPNPAQSEVMIQFMVDGAGEKQIRVRLHDVLGRYQGTLFEGTRQAGEYHEKVDVGHLNAGQYILSIQIGAVVTTRSLTKV